MKQNRKKNIKLAVLVLILLLGIGFAALTATLKVDGTVNIDKATWDVHFENVEVKEGSVTANPEPTTDNTTTTEMTYTINFTKPGDFYEFTVDIVNDGTIDAMVNLLENKTYASNGTTEIELPSYLTNTVTYSDGVAIQENQELLHGTSEKIKVRVEFKKDIQTSELPSSGDTTVVFKFKGDYKQKDENSVKKPSVIEWDKYYGGDATSGTTIFNSSWYVYGRENLTNGNKEICGNFSSGPICIKKLTQEEFYNDVTCQEDLTNCTAEGYIANKKAEFESIGANCNLGDGWLNCDKEDIHCYLNVFYGIGCDYNLTSTGACYFNDDNDDIVCHDD